MTITVEEERDIRINDNKALIQYTKSTGMSIYAYTTWDSMSDRYKLDVIGDGFLKRLNIALNPNEGEYQVINDNNWHYSDSLTNDDNNGITVVMSSEEDLIVEALKHAIV